jgi:hypothetical protein
LRILSQGISLLYFFQPAASDFVNGNAGLIGFHVEDRGAVKHVYSSNAELVSFAPEEFYYGKANGIGAPRRPGGKDSVGVEFVGGRI